MGNVTFTPRIASQMHVRIVDSEISTCERLSLLFRLEGFQTSFALEWDHAVIGTTDPDVLLVDFELQGGLGLNLLRKVRADKPGAQVIMLAKSPDVSATVLAMKFGAVDVVQKPINDEHLLTCVRDALRRDIQVGALVDGGRSVEVRGFKQLTGREREVLGFIANGQSNKSTARVLNISPRTVEVHRARIMYKLGAKNTADLMRIIFTR